VHRRAAVRHADDRLANASVRILNTDGTVPMVANGAISQFARVFAAASGKVSSTGGVVEGMALTAASADGDVIEVLPLPDVGGRLFEAVVASTVITNTVTETAFDNSNFTLDANLLKVGDQIEIEGSINFPSTNATDTATVKVYIGSTVIATSAVVDVANGDTCEFRASLTIRTIGAGGTVVAEGFIVLGVPGTAVPKYFTLASTAIDTTATQLIKDTITWSVANAGNQARQDTFRVRRRPAA
jgi:hypothetical protein